MDRARVLEIYDLDPLVYESTCSAIGLKNPATLTGEQIEQFDKVRGWLDSREVTTFAEASDRFKTESEAKPEAVVSKLQSVFERSAEVRADTALDDVLTVLQRAEATVHKGALQAFYKRAATIVQSPEYQEKLRQACDGEKIEADLSIADGDVSGLASLAAVILHQQVMIFCHKHRAILQSRADSLKIRERQLLQQLQHKDQSIKAIRRLTKNLFVVIGVLVGVSVLGVVAGVNYPAAIACTKGDTICLLRFRGGVVQLEHKENVK